MPSYLLSLVTLGTRTVSSTTSVMVEAQRSTWSGVGAGVGAGVRAGVGEGARVRVRGRVMG